MALEYKEEELNALLQNRDYLGAAEYLRKRPTGDISTQYILNNKIDELERVGEIQNARLGKMDENQQDAYHFISAMDGQGVIPHLTYDKNQGKYVRNSANFYGDQYVNNINALKGDNGETVSKLKITLEDDDAYNSFLGKLNSNNTDISKDYKIGVNVNPKTGKYIITTNTGNTNLPKIYNAIKEMDYDRMNPISVPTFGGSQFYMNGMQQSYSIEGVTTKNNTTSISDLTPLRNAMYVYNKAKDVHTEATDIEESTTTEDKMFVSPFLGQGQANAYARLKQGSIDLDTYNKIVKERTDAYNTLLAQTDLTQYKVYMSELDSEEGSTMEEVDNPIRKGLMRNILTAIKDNRITYSAATNGDEVGTYITITPKVDNEDEFSTGEAGKGYRIFVPNLFKSSCDETFNNDTKTKASRDLVDLQHWKYAKNLKDGSRIGYDDELGYYAVDKQSNKIPISREDALLELDKDNIIKSSANTILQYLDENGNIKNPKPGFTDINTSANSFAYIAIQELLQRENYDDATLLMAQNSIANSIKKLVSSYIDMINSDR